MAESARRRHVIPSDQQKNRPVSIAGIVPGWLIGYLVREDDTTCEYRLLPVVSLVGDVESGEIEPVVMLPDGKTVRASDVTGRAFAAGPNEDAGKIAAAHAAGRGRVVARADKVAAA